MGAIVGSPELQGDKEEVSGADYYMGASMRESAQLSAAAAGTGERSQ